MKNIPKKINKLKKVNLNKKKNVNPIFFSQKNINSYGNKNVSIYKKNIINKNLDIKINNLAAKYNKIITSLNNKINNSEFINNENDLLVLYYNELNEFWNYVLKVN